MAFKISKELAYIITLYTITSLISVHHHSIHYNHSWFATIFFSLTQQIQPALSPLSLFAKPPFNTGYERFRKLNLVFCKPVDLLYSIYVNQLIYYIVFMILNLYFYQDGPLKFVFLSGCSIHDSKSIFPSGCSIEICFETNQI